MLVVVVGLALGVGASTFVYARGASYLTNDPAACVNCHVMREQYGWIAGSGGTPSTAWRAIAARSSPISSPRRRLNQKIV